MLEFNIIIFRILTPTNFSRMVKLYTIFFLYSIIHFVNFFQVHWQHIPELVYDSKPWSSIIFFFTNLSTLLSTTTSHFSKIEIKVTTCQTKVWLKFWSSCLVNTTLKLLNQIWAFVEAAIYRETLEFQRCVLTA